MSRVSFLVNKKNRGPVLHSLGRLVVCRLFVVLFLVIQFEWTTIWAQEISSFLSAADIGKVDVYQNLQKLGVKSRHLVEDKQTILWKSE